MTRFIDTNIFVACLRGRAGHVREKFLQHLPEEILVPFQVLAEFDRSLRDHGALQ